MNSFTDLEKLELWAQQIHDSGIDITPDQKNEWTMIAYACASLGEVGREPFHLISSNYPGYSREECDRHFSYCMKTSKNCVSIGTIVKIARDHGLVLSLPRGRRPKNEEQRREEQTAQVTYIKELLIQEKRWRYNTLTCKTEMSIDGINWIEVDDRLFNTIITDLREKGLRVKDNELRSLLDSSGFSPDYDPPAEWLSCLKPWNPDTDPDYIGEFFIGHMEFGPLADPNYYDKMFRRWLVGLVALWLGRIDENPVMLTFCGKEHVGKTFFAINVLPPQLRRYLTTIRPNDPVNNDTMLTLAEVLLVIFDEININSDSKSNMMKYIITSGTTNLREAYGRYRKARRRRASLIATTNYLQFLRETEGSRRYVCIDLVSTKNIFEFPLNYEGAYAQALYLLNHGFSPKPTFEESLLVSEHNRAFMAPNDCEEALLTFLRLPTEQDNPVALSAGDLLQELSNHGFYRRSFSAVEIGKTMKRLGFASKMVRGHNKYLVVIIDAAAHQQERVNDAADTQIIEKEFEEPYESPLVF